MEVNGWNYYNHAAIPTCAPHETPDLTAIENGNIWKINGRPLLARWTTDFDCGYETDWWFMIRTAPFVVEDLSKSSQKYIRQSLKKCFVEKVDILQKMDELYRVYVSAHQKYKNAQAGSDYESFAANYQRLVDSEENWECWGSYDRATGIMVGYMMIRVYDDYAGLAVAKFVPEFLKHGASAALYYTVLCYYLNERNKKYVSSGSRNINHKTNTEDYKIRHFGYKKAFCKLHITYTPQMAFLVKMLYPFRGILLLMDGITKIHQVNAVLQMEEIVRKNE